MIIDEKENMLCGDIIKYCTYMLPLDVVLQQHFRKLTEVRMRPKSTVKNSKSFKI